MGKYERAKAELKTALDQQQTISVPKLRRILQDLNIAIEGQTESREVHYLKQEIKKLHKRLQQQGQTNKKRRQV